MKRFVTKALVYLAVLVGIHIWATYQADGRFDTLYLRYTHPKSQSLILGTSKSAQGLLPSVLNPIIQEKGYAPLYNFSFTNANSPYGEVYLNALKKKLDTESDGKKTGLFILAVDVWSLSTSVNNTDDDPNEFRENDLAIANLDCFTCSPNFQYFLDYYDKAWGNILFNPLQSSKTELHEDGWLEVNVSLDEASIQRRKTIKINEYQHKVAPNNQFSPNRYESLAKIIDYLQKYGEVYLVKLPVCAEIQALEQQQAPNFDEQIQDLADQYHASYINFSKPPFSEQAYTFTDCNHLAQASGKVVSELITEQIIQRVE